jgi:uncharacterized membrane protein YtjA (UPF0391 family)
LNPSRPEPLCGRGVGLASTPYRGWTDSRKGHAMPLWSIVFFAVAIVAGLFGYAGIAAASAGIAQILFILFMGLGILALVVYHFEDRF